MCDCYTERCKGCNQEIEMHLSDYDTDRDEIEVFCKGCMPVERQDGVVWKYRDSEDEEWKTVFVRALTKNAMANASGNHPNSIDVEVVGVPDGTLEIVDERNLRM